MGERYARDGSQLHLIQRKVYQRNELCKDWGVYRSNNWLSTWKWRGIVKLQKKSEEICIDLLEWKLYKQQIKQKIRCL